MMSQNIQSLNIFGHHECIRTFALYIYPSSINYELGYLCFERSLLNEHYARKNLLE